MAKKDIIRLYRAEGYQEGGKVPDWAKQDPQYKQSEQARGRWFTDNLEEAQWYITHEYPEGKIVFVDLPKHMANQYRINQLKKFGGKTISENPYAFSLRPDQEYFLPKEIVK